MEVVLNHRLTYQIDESASVAEVIATLEANQALLRASARVLERCIPGLEIQQSTVSVKSLAQESPLVEMFAFALVMTYQEELKKEVPQIVEKLTGVDVPGEYDTLVTVLVMLLAIYGIRAVFKRLFPGRDPKHLKEEYTRLINVAGDYIDVPAEDVDQAIKDAAGKKERRSNEAAAKRFFRPVRGRKNRGIEGPGVASISEDAIAEVPHDAILVEEEPLSVTSEFFNDVTINLHATDRDRASAGWAGHIRGVVDTRVRMRLDKSIKPEQLFGRKRINGDILVVYQENDQGEFEPTEFHLLAIKKQKRGRARK